MRMNEDDFRKRVYYIYRIEGRCQQQKTTGIDQKSGLIYERVDRLGVDCVKNKDMQDHGIRDIYTISIKTINKQ